jgi:bifunctional non-homologous end joining protein LigD
MEDTFIKPMLAVLVDRPFNKSNWLFEIKYDGVRATAYIKNGDIDLISRYNKVLNKKYPQIIQSLKSLPNCIIDGEICVLDEHNVSRFQLLQNYRSNQVGRLVYIIFDILNLNGNSLLSTPLLRRKEILRNTVKEDKYLKISKYIVGNGVEAFEHAEKRGMEGIIGKEINSHYLPGSRTKFWIKIKVNKIQNAIICGFTAPKGKKKFFGTLILGAYDKKGKLVFIGQTGGTQSDKEAFYIYNKLKPLTTTKVPFDKVPKMKNKTWVTPDIVCKVKFVEWTRVGLMRQAILLKFDEDIDPKTVKKEV